MTPVEERISFGTCAFQATAGLGGASLTDLGDPSKCISDFLDRSRSKSHFETSDVVPSEKSQTTAPVVKWYPREASDDSRLATTLSVVARELDTSPLKSTTEALAFLLAEVDFGRRPQLMVNEDGRPGFATATDAFYLHLTIDDPGTLTWYAIVNEHEVFDEQVDFDRKNLPSTLHELFVQHS
jgi:hypothetical protein